jgi:hypothetical protein
MLDGPLLDPISRTYQVRNVSYRQNRDAGSPADHSSGGLLSWLFVLAGAGIVTIVIARKAGLNK